MGGDTTLRAIAPGNDRVVLLVVAHADDPALFLGGTIALWADAGWRVVLLRVTDDRWDSVGLSEPETIQRNHDELRAAARALGISEIVELGWATDQLGDASEVATVPPGTNGFLRGVMRGMARNRMLHDVGAAPPFRLVRWSDGRITLDDPETGRHIELDPFGPTNAGAFAALLGQPAGRP